MSDITPFSFEAHDVRVVMLDGQPWFVVLDVCAALGIENPRNAVTRLRSVSVRLADVQDPAGRTRQTNVVNESGLYRLILRSNKPEAERFQDWVTDDVLPEIRRTGSYSQALTPAEMLLQQAQMMVAQERRTAALEAQQREHREQIEDLMGEQGVHRAQIEDLMGEQGVHRAEIDTLKENHDRVAAIGYANLRKIRSDVDFLRRLGVRAAAIARRDGLPVSRAHSTVWGEVNVWPLAVWDEAYRDVTGRDPS